MIEKKDMLPVRFTKVFPFLRVKDSSDPAGRDTVSAPIAPPGAAGDAPQRADAIYMVVLFVLALVTNVLLTINNWSSGFLLGHEFRQSQTAIIARYIDQQNNFSPHYETPIMGKPWEVPLELPIYEWAVVLISRATHIPHVQAARAVSMASLYLMLPAVYLLLRAMGLSRSRRLLVLAFVLATPVYIFYGRAFLMDTMAVMFAAWFLAGFVEMMRTRKIGWFLVCTLMGMAGGLLKSLTLFAWVFPAAVYGGYLLWGDLFKRRSIAAAARTAAWGVGAMVLPTIAMQWWVRMTDAIKEAHSSAYFLSSKNLAKDNYGTFSLESRLQKTTWIEWFDRWRESIAQPWVIFLMVGFGVLLLTRERKRVLIATGLFMFPQFLIPYAYTGQDYYYTACAVFLVGAFGFVANGVIDLAWPRWLRWVMALVPMAAMYLAYANYYYPQHRIWSPGGTGLTIALRDYLPQDSVVVISGSDWGPIIPYYAHKRALMIRNGLDRNRDYLERAFNGIADEDVSALVLTWDQRKNVELAQQVTAKFNLDPEPTFSYTNADVYVSRYYRASVLARLRGAALPEGITSGAKDSIPGENDAPMILTAGVARRMFSQITPLPSKCRFDHGYQIWNVGGEDCINAHPNSELWVPLPPGATEVEWEFAMLPECYSRDGDRTNGADFIIDVETADGRRSRRLFHRLLNPAKVEGDRGVQHEKIKVTASPGEVLVFRTGANGSYAFDWCYWRQIKVH